MLLGHRISRMRMSETIGDMSKLAQLRGFDDTILRMTAHPLIPHMLSTQRMDEYVACQALWVCH